MFCLKHRYIDAHRCTFDHRSLERERLIQSLSLIVKDKVPNRIKYLIYPVLFPMMMQGFDPRLWYQT